MDRRLKLRMQRYCFSDNCANFLQFFFIFPWFLYIFFALFLLFLLICTNFTPMLTTKTKAIVLRTVKYGEGGLVVDMLTEKMGRVSFMVKLPSSRKKGIHKQLFMPLSLVEVDFDFRAKASLQRLRDIRMAVPLTGIALHPHKLAVAMFLAEFLLHATRDENDNGPLFSFVSISLEWLEGVESGFANFHLIFMIRLSRFIGFFPNTDGASEGKYFDLLGACFTSSPPLHGHFLVPEEAAKISLLMRLNYKTMHLCAMTRAERNRCTEVILEYYRLHVPGFPALRSLEVLRQLFV